MQQVIRVFPRRTSYTPDDEYAFVGNPPLIRPDASEVHVSCVFTWDKPMVEDLARNWAQYYPSVKVGGPAYDDHGDEFAPGMYVKRGEVITSRGCLNKCSYCFVPKREGCLRLLKIKEGWDILDNNLLACPKNHIEAVFDMLSQQKHKAMFRGGLEARRIDKWFLTQLSRIRLQCLFLAMDRAGDEGLVGRAVEMLAGAGYNNRQICCYVLVGHRGDTPEEATKRLHWVRDIGAMPFAMYFRDAEHGRETLPKEWQKVVRPFCRPTAIFAPPKQTEEASIWG